MCFMIKKISFCLCFIICSCVSVPVVDKFNDGSIELELTITNEKESLSGKLICKNISATTMKIPSFYLSFSADEIQKHKFRSNWLDVRRADGSKIRYLGIYCEPSLDSLKKETTLLKKNSEFIIYINDICRNYDFIPGEKVTIKYRGPLGISNTVECVVGNDIL